MGNIDMGQIYIGQIWDIYIWGRYGTDMGQMWGMGRSRTR